MRYETIKRVFHDKFGIDWRSLNKGAWSNIVAPDDILEIAEDQVQPKKRNGGQVENTWEIVSRKKSH